ncbi:MAG: glycosyl transferase [Dyadobacter sp. 50-39]|uniref:glycosyl transferase n=1 Tax=Dyadobacter sp. 50-39 TaxID=1895756 RepID=UPI00095EC511|nr:glycosyl transferase [Dyadobacter sp. 50-39]OJV14855.1 MAG: glycosyl transferase [Dyadobacter sp. 50-39]
MQNFCTLFNSGYLSRGLAMYNSLVRQGSDFHLYIFAFDDACDAVLRRLDLSNATVISLQDFETPELLAVKGSRTTGEYCWTCTSFTIWHCIHAFSLDHCTYLDADLLFFADPKVLTDEMGDNSVLITAHRYSPEYDQSENSGVYCVQFVTFKKTDEGLAVLAWWMNACLDWCYARFEDGKFGDQKYLDDWTERFPGVHVLQHPGGGVAPWNAVDYVCEKSDERVFVQKAGAEKVPLVFYHFHDFRYCVDRSFRLTAEQYRLPGDIIRSVYSSYIKALSSAESQIRLTDPAAVFHEQPMVLKWIKVSLSRRIQFGLRGRYKNYTKKNALT